MAGKVRMDHGGLRKLWCLRPPMRIVVRDPLVTMGTEVYLGVARVCGLCLVPQSLRELVRGPPRPRHAWSVLVALASMCLVLLLPGEVVPPVTTASCPPAGAPFDPPLPPVFPPHSPPSYEMSNEDIAVFSDSMSILALVNISGSFDVAGKLVAISRSDNSVRAVATRLNMPIPPVPSWPFAGLLPFSFLLYGNVNDGIVHFVFQPSEPYLSMYVLDLVGPEVDFVPNADAGTYELPLVFRF